MTSSLSSISQSQTVSTSFGTSLSTSLSRPFSESASLSISPSKSSSFPISMSSSVGKWFIVFSWVKCHRIYELLGKSRRVFLHLCLGPLKAICTKSSCDIVFMEMKNIRFCLRKNISGSYLKQNNSDLVFQTGKMRKFVAGRVTKR